MNYKCTAVYETYCMLVQVHPMRYRQLPSHQKQKLLQNQRELQENRKLQTWRKLLNHRQLQSQRQLLRRLLQRMHPWMELLWLILSLAQQNRKQMQQEMMTVQTSRHHQLLGRLDLSLHHRLTKLLTKVIK